MLRPTKHSHPDRTVVHIALLLCVRLRFRRVESFDQLRSYVKNAVGGSDPLFVPALNFLFLLGLITYHVKVDSFEYVGPDEII